MNFLASFEVTGLPHPSNFSAFLIGKVEMIMKPYFSLVHISRSIWSGDESLFQQRLKALQPDGKKLVEILCQLDDEADPHKERVFDFTKRFLGDLRENKASTFLRFVKGFEMVTDYTKKNLNSIQWCHWSGKKWLQSLWKCLSCLKYFFTYDHFEEILNKVLDHLEYWNAFYLI